MQIKTYTDAESFVARLKESQQSGQRVRLGKKEGTLEVFEAPSRTFGRGVGDQSEVDQVIIAEQEALGQKLNELVRNKSFPAPGSAQLQRNPAQVIRPYVGEAPVSVEKQQEMLLSGIQQTLSALHDLQVSAPGTAPVTLPSRLLQIHSLLQQSGPDVQARVARAVVLLNAEVSSLRFMLKSASDPGHPVGQFCTQVRAAHAGQTAAAGMEGIRPGVDVLPSTAHASDPQAFRRFFTRAFQAIASALESPRVQYLAAQLRGLVERVSHPGLRTSQLKNAAMQAQALAPEIQQALADHPLSGAVNRVLETVKNSDFWALENLLTTELLDAANALADHDQVDLPHEMLQMGRQLAGQSDISLKDLSQAVAVIQLILPQLQALVDDPRAFAPETSAFQGTHQLSPERCEADRKCVSDFIVHFSQLIEPSPWRASDALALQSTLVRHPEWQNGAATPFSPPLATRANRADDSIAVTEDSGDPPTETGGAPQVPSEPPVEKVAKPKGEVKTEPTEPDRDLIQADLMIQALDQHEQVNGVAWRQEGLELKARLQQGLAASQGMLDAGSADPQAEYEYQQSLYMHLARLERLLDISDSQRPLHRVVAAHGAHSDRSLEDQLQRWAPGSTSQAFSAWLEGQLVHARISLASIKPVSLNPAIASSVEASQRGRRLALESAVDRLQRARDDALKIWGVGATEALAFEPLTVLQREVEQAVLGQADERPTAMFDTSSLQPLQDKLRQQVDAQLRHRLQFNEGPLNGMSDADFAAAIGLQAEMDYLASASDEMVMLQIWAQRAALGWESSQVGPAAGVMADALQACATDLRERARALQSISTSLGATVAVRLERSPNGRMEEVLEDAGSDGASSAWMTLASQAAAQALLKRVDTLESVSAVLRTNSQSMV